VGASILAGQSVQITLVSYNIHACIGGDARFDPDRVVAVLQELNADLVALQEVEHCDVGGDDLLAYLAKKTGRAAIAGQTFLRGGRPYGNGLLTRLPIVAESRFDLSIVGFEPRGAIDVVVDCHGQTMRLIVTHLGLKVRERQYQTSQLLSLLESSTADISALVGDLNEWFPWGSNLRRLRARFGPTPSYATYPARWPLFALDRIWISPASRLAALQVHASTLTRVASDHLPLKATIEA